MNPSRVAPSHFRRLAAVAVALVAGLSLAALSIVTSQHFTRSAKADAYDGLRSYHDGRRDEAIRLLRRAAWQDDNVFAQLQLGDIYRAKSESDRGYKDNVEAAVWYYLALLNVGSGENLFLDTVAEKHSERLTDAENALKAVYKDLLQDERIDVRNRVIYIEACRGPDGLILLGQLYDHRFDRTEIPGLGGPRVSVGVDYIETPLSLEGAYPSPIYDSGNSPGGRPPSIRRLADPQPIQPSDIEARLFYTLADLSGHPYAKDYLGGLTEPTTYGTDGTGAKRAEVQARAKADQWLAPFEFYAAETRYRGESQSGLVLSDECPVNQARERALLLGTKLIPNFIISEMLQFLQFARDGSDQERRRGIFKFQDFLGDTQTGVLDPIQLVRLVQIAAVRGNKKAQRCLGLMYVHGVGVVRNLVRAVKWLSAASEQSDGEAMYALSELYSLGGPGVEKSEDKANRYRQGAAISGYEPVRAELLRLLATAPKPDEGPDSSSPPAQPPRRHHHYRRGPSEPRDHEQ